AALKVFRDDSALAANPHLWGSVAAALDSSRFMVVLASPRSAASSWVARELEHWLAANRPGGILPGLADGDLHWDNERGRFDAQRSTALPGLLAEAMTDEPLFIDLRWVSASPSSSSLAREPRFQSAIASLAAPIHGCSREELEGAEV